MVCFSFGRGVYFSFFLWASDIFFNTAQSGLKYLSGASKIWSNRIVQ